MAEIGVFLEELSSADPVPGGGSVAALEVSMAASLLVMVCNLTAGRKRYESVAARIAIIRAEAEALRERAQHLVQDDIEAYGQVADVLSLPRDTEDAREDRRRKLQRALQSAVAPPLETMRVASGVMTLAHELVRIGNASAISDVGSAALAARAGYQAGRLNVEINLSGIRDEQWVKEARQSLASIPEVDTVEREVVQLVEASIRGDQQ